MNKSYQTLYFFLQTQFIKLYLPVICVNKTYGLLAFFLPAIVIITSCGSNDELENRKSAIPLSNTLESVFTSQIDENLLEPLPSPLQIALIFKSAGLTFQDSLTNAFSNASNYSTTFSKLLNMGAYSSDFIYHVINEKPNPSRNYLKVIQELASDIGFGQIINTKENITRLDNNVNNIDSLAIIISDIQMNTDQHFRKNNEHLKGLVIFAGAWIEAMHLAIQNNGFSRNFNIPKALIDQRDILKRLLKNLHLCRGKKQNEKLNELIAHLEAIHTRLDDLHLESFEEKDFSENKKEMDSLRNTIQAVRNMVIHS